MLVSEQTRQFYAHGNIMERWLSHALGVFRMAMEEHLPLTLITELDLKPEILDRHRVLILPNTVCLSDAQVETIRGFVQRGGGLVATCETSLCDERGRSRGDFALKDLFGTTFEGRPLVPQPKHDLDANFAIVINDQYWAQRGNAGTFRFADFADSIFATDPRLKHLVLNGQAGFKGPMIRPGIFQPPMKPALLYFPDGSREAFPIAANGEQGKGRVVYFAAGIDAANFTYAYPYHRIVLSRAVRWAACAMYPVEVKAPMCVQSTFWRQEDSKGKRLIVHLWNGLNTTSDHGQQDVETPLREEAVAIHGIELRLRGVKFSRIHCEPGGAVLEARSDHDTMVVTVPPVEVHSAVVFEEM